ncbi:MAG: hypothetical protein GF388_05520 [Candidatus Aegiribacteria sp.]|nr:hypothetical protein [Candidatus Aegiribacteria sp.]MBD3294663.1 hypothetical protein [Candidatus Fermentibacteria bacterium]
MTLLLAILVSFPVRVAVLGDRTGGPDDVEFEIAVNAIVEMCPDVVLSVGDFVEGNGDVDTAVEDWERVMPVLERLTGRFPFVFTPGNNDIWNDETEEYWSEYTGTSPSRVEEAAGVHFAVWDSSIGGTLTASDLQSIRELVTEVDGEPWIFVTHKPFWFMAYQDSAVIEEFRDLMEEHRPLAVVGGHIHLMAAERENGILYISAGPSGSSVPDPDPDTGDFTQLGWLTVWEDSAAFAALDARGVYPETLNTGEEMNLAYLYRQHLIRARPVEQELESSTVTLMPVEERQRTVHLEVESGSWDFQPESLQVELDEEPVELVFSQNPSGSPYPSPVINVSVSYGERDKELHFSYPLQVHRIANAFATETEIDGGRGPEEYRGGVHSDFADFSGDSADIPETGFQAASDGSRLQLFMQMEDVLEGDEDYAGFIFALPEDQFLWIKAHSDGSADQQRVLSSGELEEARNAAQVIIQNGEGVWSVELAVDTRMLELLDGHAGVHVYRSTGNDFGTWVYPIRFDRNSMGSIWLQTR